MNWVEYFVKMAELVASKSKDRSTKVGVVVVGPNNEVRSTGYNGFPRGIDDNREEYHQRPMKYSVTEHAERNAIYNAARVGVSLDNCTMYFNYEPIPCTNCARAVIQAGIKKVVGYNRDFPGNKAGNWTEDAKISRQMLEEAGIEIVIIPENKVD